jgi:hypothetical protein
MRPLQELAGMLPIAYEQLGERFLRYAHRVRSLTINGDKMVHTFDPPGTHQCIAKKAVTIYRVVWQYNPISLYFEPREVLRYNGTLSGKNPYFL